MDELDYRSIWSRSDDIVARAVLVKRRVSNGAIAGIVVGTCVGVGLLLICLYPLLIRKRRERRRLQHQDSNGIESENGPAPPTGASDDPQQRLSSEDSFKPPSGDASRGALEGGSVKDLEWNPNGAPHDRAAPAQSRDIIHIDTNVSPIACAAHHVDEVPPPASVYPNGQGEYMPDHLVGSRQGSNADYYSPSIPSSHFGMYTTDGPQNGSQIEGKRSLSRGNSLRHALGSLFGSRKNTRDQSLPSLVSPTSPTFGEAATKNAPREQQEAASRGFITNDVTSESPTELSPPEASYFSSSSTPRAALGPSPNIQQAGPPQGAVQTPPQSPPPTEQQFKVPSPPTNPAPGTVNPMDIMPATTDSELWHRTEHQLYMSYNQPHPNPESSPDQTYLSEKPVQLETPEQQINYYQLPIDSPSPFALPANGPQTELVTQAAPFVPLTNGADVPQMEPVVQAPTPAPVDYSMKEEIVEDNENQMTEIPSHSSHLSPMNHRGHSRHPSYGSDVSTPLPGPASTNASTLNTPATQLDTPSPSDSTPSDFRSSASPSRLATNASPRTGVYPCDEPGCGQTFDQPHKLKHHQRYHIRQHKCQYPGCTKGFGTKTHLQRHVNDIHEKKKKFHCAVAGCDWSRQGGRSFPRKDNWKRHMMNTHNFDQRALPEPEEADEDMTGV